MSPLILLLSLLGFITGADSVGARPGVDLVFVGDAMQHQAQIDRARKIGGDAGYDYSDCFRHIAPAITKADYAVCNLEVPLGGGPDYTGYPCFSAPDSYAVALRDAGFDMMLTSNNHCLDRGDKALRRTITVLDSIGVDHVGTYHDATDREERIPYIRNIKGIRFGFLNYTYGTNGIEPRHGAEVALIDTTRMAREIEMTRRAGAEILVVAMHWGVEYVLLHNAEQRRLADFLVGKGVDLIIGGHPHVIQPMEIRRNERERKDVLIVYSLGNFISNMNTGDTRGGAMVSVRVERDEDGVPRLKYAGYDTLFSAKPDGESDNFQVIPAWMPHRIPESQRPHWQLFERSAQRIFDQHNKGVGRRHRKEPGITAD